MLKFSFTKKMRNHALLRGFFGLETSFFCGLSMSFRQNSLIFTSVMRVNADVRLTKVNKIVIMIAYLMKKLQIKIMTKSFGAERW